MLNPNNPESLENDLSLVFRGQSEFWGVGRRSLCFFESSLGGSRSIVVLGDSWSSFSLHRWGPGKSCPQSRLRAVSC